MIIVTMKHVREANLCSSGARYWFKQHNLSWHEFLTTGLSAEVLEATGDELAFRVTKIARQEAENGR